MGGNFSDQASNVTVDARLMATLERSFARMAGGDGIINVKELQAALGLRRAEIDHTGLTGRVEAVGGDFFKEVPAGGDIYTSVRFYIVKFLVGLARGLLRR